MYTTYFATYTPTSTLPIPLYVNRFDVSKQLIATPHLHDLAPSQEIQSKRKFHLLLGMMNNYDEEVPLYREFYPH